MGQRGGRQLHHDYPVPAGAGHSHPQQDGIAGFRLYLLCADLLLKHRHLDGDGRYQRLCHTERYVHRHRQGGRDQAGQDHGQGPAAGRWEREYLCGSRRKRLWLSTCNRLRSANSHDRGCRRAALLRQLYGQGIRLQRQGRQRQLSMDALRCQRRSRPDLQRRIARHLP